MDISIIIPIYNVERYIKRCLDSIAEQESPNVSIECILVDDCTPDQSSDIVYNFINSYQGIIQFKFVKHEKNLGLSCARNTGLRHASGNYIMFVDSDDYLMPHSIEYLFRELNNYPNTDMVIGNHFDEEHNCKNFGTLEFPKYVSNQYEILKAAYEKKLSGNAWNKMIRREILVNNHIIFVEGQLYEDILWSITIAKAVSSVLLLPKTTYIYKYNAESIMHSKENRKNTIVHSITYTCNKLMDDITKEHWGRCCIFIWGHLLQAIDLDIQYKCPELLHEELKMAKKRLYKLTITKVHVLSSIFFLSMFYPFCIILKSAVFRHNYYRIIKLLYMIEG